MKRFQILSDTLQDLIFSENTAANIRKASVLGDIEENVTLLAEMVGQVLMGFLNPADFESELQKELGLETAVAKQIANQINAEIFSLVQTELRKLYPPTIKTPTVISPYFAPASVRPLADFGEAKPASAQGYSEAKQAPNPPLGGATAKLEAAQPSISEFEKRFFKPDPTTPSSIKTPMPAEIAIATSENKPISEEPKKLIPVPEDFIKPSDPIIIKESEKPKIQPVIPLPTYIQSQFQKRSGNVIDLRNRT